MTGWSFDLERLTRTNERSADSRSSKAGLAVYGWSAVAESTKWTKSSASSCVLGLSCLI